jgi:glycosyltransferase involved in cell wall biosynthesis
MTALRNPAVESISAFFPCYNDAPTIASVVTVAHSTLSRLGVDFEIIVIDDGSSDRSRQILDELVAHFPRLRVIEHAANRGYGGALLSGFGAATKQWVFYTDGDAQFDPGELEDLVKEASATVDVVQGWKIKRADNWQRALIGRVYHHGVAHLFGLRIRDTDCDFRLIRKALLDRVQLRHTSGVICVEMVRKFQDAGARFVEVGVHHYPRVHGHSQFFRFSRVFRTLWDLSWLWLRLVVLRGEWLGGVSRRLRRGA